MRWERALNADDSTGHKGWGQAVGSKGGNGEVEARDNGGVSFKQGILDRILQWKKYLPNQCELADKRVVGPYITNKRVQ